ncbi:MAG: mevalonate kinase [Ignisphaera sp.]|uniref:Mevalonate kinase n=1 Tax=Ignisphaera aggregans TaxID=334771 RepID=A0A832CZV9_9CREN
MLVHLEVPTKITLFGEHAVVYSIPAIATTIPIRISIIGNKTQEGTIQIKLKQGLKSPIHSVEMKRDGTIIDLYPDYSYIKRLFNYVLTSLNICEEKFEIGDRNYGYHITIDSPLPVGIGLGTSAAISVGIVTLCVLLNNYIKDVEDHRREIAKTAWNVEKVVQGSASPMDTFTIALGGLRYIEPTLPEAYPINIDYRLPILVGYTDKRGTTAELIQRVRNLKAKNERIFKNILNIIKEIVEEAKNALINQDLESLGMLMNINHGILKALNVVNIEHDSIAHTLKNAGALGVKTSGAGNGGAFVALAPSDEHLERLAVIAEALGAKIVSKSICYEGIKVVNIVR